MPKNVRTLSRRAVIAGATSALVAAGSRIRPARAATKVRFLTNWFAEAEHGGFYQAKATGLYEKAGLDVDIQMGGPQVNGIQLLGGGDADIIVSYDIECLDSVAKGLPAVAIGAINQFDLQGIMTHTDRRGNPDSSDLGRRVPLLARAGVSLPGAESIAAALVHNWPMLLRALCTTLRSRCRRSRSRSCWARSSRSASCRTRRSRRASSPTRCSAGHAGRGGRAADHHPGEEHRALVDDLRDGRARFFRSSPTPPSACKASTPVCSATSA